MSNPAASSNINKSDIDRIFNKETSIKGVVHLAGYKSISDSIINPEKYYDNNIRSLEVIIDTMERYNVKDIIFSSSCTVYGEPDTLPITEDSNIKIITSRDKEGINIIKKLVLEIEKFIEKKKYKTKKKKIKLKILIKIFI